MVGTEKGGNHDAIPKNKSGISMRETTNALFAGFSVFFGLISRLLVSSWFVFTPSSPPLRNALFASLRTWVP